MNTEHNIMEIFEELSFIEKWKRVIKGIKESENTGDHKYACLQLLRLLSPICAVLIPIIIITLIIFIPTKAPVYEVLYEVTYEKMEEHDIPDDEIIPKPPETKIVDFSKIDSDNFAPPTLITELAPVDAPGPESEVKNLSDIPKNVSPLIFIGLQTRTGNGRDEAIADGGGGQHTELAVLNALRWLKMKQLPDGSWEKHKPAMTSLALLTYMGHGENAGSKEFGATIQKAIEFLIDAQEADGRFKGRDGHDYTQPIVAYALAEAHSMLRIPMIKEAAERALQVVIDGQHETGGWDYGCKQSERNDTSYMGWCAQALVAGKCAGLENDGLRTALKKAVKGFKGNYHQQGGFGYTGPDPRHGLTGAGVLCLQLLGASRDIEVRKGLMTLTQTSKLDWDDPKGSIYYWYYNTQAFYQNGGTIWDKWNASLTNELINSQHVLAEAVPDAEGKMMDVGWWDGSEINEAHSDGLVMDTCLCALQLEVYYRKLRTYQEATAMDINVDIYEDRDIVIEIKGIDDEPKPEIKKKKAIPTLAQTSHELSS